MDNYRRKVDFIADTIVFNTWLVCLLIGNLVAVLLVLAYRLRFPKNRIWRLFITSRLLQLVIVILLLSEDFRRFPSTGLIISLTGLAAGIAEVLALLKLLGVCTGRVRRNYFALAGVSAAGQLLFFVLYTGEVSPVVLASLTGVCLLIYPVYILCITMRETPLQFVMGLLYGAVMFSLLGRAAVDLPLVPLSMDTAASELLLALFYVGIYLLMFLGTAGFMLLSRELSYAELERVATYDELTGILNRRAFELRARPILAAAAKEVSPFSFLLLDVDHFKEVNDTYGHDTGDRVLRDLARKFEGQLGNGDLFGRFGGEEFAVLLHRADEAVSDELAERLRCCVLDSVIDGVPLSYTVSIGVITVVSKEQVALSTLYKWSDAALYQAKQQGRNCIVRSRETPL